jgi:glycosyltransferase involved in cell wall biosynthesis
VSALAFAIPGDLGLATGGYAYDREVLKRLPAHGVAATHLALPGSFPDPTAEDMAETGRLLLSRPWDEVLMIDGLAYGAFPEAAAAGLAGRVVALVHHPLGLETGLSPERAAALVRTETAALRHAAQVIVTSATTGDILAAEFAVPAGKIAVAEPGVARAPRATGSPEGAPPHLLAVGSIVPRKGYDVLVSALARLAQLSWRLTIAGDPGRSPETAAALAQQIAALGLGERIELLGVLSDAELAARYAAADIFVMSSHFEGYGMVLTEALARGLPLVTTTGGAAAATAPDAAALKVPPGDARALSAALARLIGDRALRARLADAAWNAAATLPDWNDTARTVADVVRSLKP